MNSVQSALIQARTEEIRSAVIAQTAESVLADLFLIYKAAETEPVEEIKAGLGQLVDKLQRTRSEALEQGARVGQLAIDLHERLRAEEAAE